LQTTQEVSTRESNTRLKFGTSIELFSDSFSIAPSGKTNIPLLGAGPKLKFVITPKKIGQRKILVRSRLNSEAVKALPKLTVSGDQDLTFDINVLPEKTMFGLTSSQLQGIQFIFSAVGFPALMIALLTFIMDSRKEKREERRSQSKPRAGKAKR
jgi:hypothetical protein